MIKEIQIFNTTLQYDETNIKQKYLLFLKTEEYEIINPFRDIITSQICSNGKSEIDNFGIFTYSESEDEFLKFTPFETIKDILFLKIILGQNIKLTDTGKIIDENDNLKFIINQIYINELINDAKCKKI